MGMQEAVRSVFQNYATFDGRASRSEFWWFILFSFIVSAVLGIIDGALFGYTTEMDTADGVTIDIQSFGILAPIWSLAVLVPTLAVGARRLHDTGRSGWWQLLFLIPLIGAIVLIVWFATRGTPGTNAYGAEPIVPEG
jgi:uncharacterized membrane protein YhaH (DUF805 family)